MGRLEDVCKEAEFGIMLNRALCKVVSKKGAFLYFWALACLAKLYASNYGLDCPVTYLCSFSAERFSKFLGEYGSYECDNTLIEQFKEQHNAPDSVIRVLRRCVKEGHGNMVAHAKVSIKEIKELFHYIVNLPDEVLFVS